MIKIKLSVLNAKSCVAVLVFSISFTLISTLATAQNRFYISITPATNFSTKNLGNTKLKTGFGADATIAFSLTKQIGFYGGWDWNKFSSDQSFAGTDVDFVETGYSIGLQFSQPIASTKMKLIVGAGGIYKHI